MSFDLEMHTHWITQLSKKTANTQQHDESWLAVVANMLKKKKSENKRVLSLLSKDELQVMTNNFTSYELNTAL